MCNWIDVYVHIGSICSLPIQEWTNEQKQYNSNKTNWKKIYSNARNSAQTHTNMEGDREKMYTCMYEYAWAWYVHVEHEKNRQNSQKQESKEK